MPMCPAVSSPGVHHRDVSLEALKPCSKNAMQGSAKQDEIYVSVDVMSAREAVNHALPCILYRTLADGGPTCASSDLLSPSWRFAIQLQLRDDPTDSSGFWWSPGHRHEVVWESNFEAFRIIGQSPSGEWDSVFHRVSEEDALEAARTHADAP